MSKSKCEKQLEKMTTERDHWRGKTDEYKQQVEEMQRQLDARDNHLKDLQRKFERMGMFMERMNYGQIKGDEQIEQLQIERDDLKAQVIELEKRLNLVKPQILKDSPHDVELHDNVNLVTGAVYVTNDPKLWTVIKFNDPVVRYGDRKQLEADLTAKFRLLMMGAVTEADLRTNFYDKEIKPYAPEITKRDFLIELTKLFLLRGVLEGDELKDANLEVGKLLWEKVIADNGFPNPEESIYRTRDQFLNAWWKCWHSTFKAKDTLENQIVQTNDIYNPNFGLDNKSPNMLDSS